MGAIYKVLSQTNPAATTLTDSYTAPIQSVVSSISVCNTSGAARTFRVSVAIAGAADTTAQYIYFDEPIPAAETFMATVGVTLSATDVVRVYASGTGVAFNLFGTQVT